MKIERDVTGGGRVEEVFGSKAPEDGAAVAQADARDLAAALSEFRRSGWGSWIEWLAQAPAVRALAATIGDQVEIDRMRALAALVGMACQSPAMVAEVLDEPEARQEAAEAAVIRKANPLRDLGGF